MSAHPIFASIVAAVLLAPAAWAAGSHSGGHTHGAHGHSAGNPAADAGEPGDPAKVVRTIEVVMRDNLYEPETISVSRGETVRFVVRNAGEQVHEFNIGTAAMHAEHQKEMAMMVEHGVLLGDRIDRERMKMDMGGGRTMEHNHANSVLLDPGTTGEVVWRFSKPVHLEFACNIPGHYEAGMTGALNVR